MGKRGPAKTPTVILKRRGSWRGDRPNEPQPGGNLPGPPKWLDRAAKQVYRQLAKHLTEMGVGKSPDSRALARYCRLWVRWKQADLFVRKYGETYPLKNDKGDVRCFMPFPQVTIMNQLSKQLSGLEGQFGLTPAARAGLNIEVPIPSKPEGKGRFFKAS